jgi:hypothetical protein
MAIQAGYNRARLASALRSVTNGTLLLVRTITDRIFAEAGQDNLMLLHAHMSPFCSKESAVPLEFPRLKQRLDG